MIKKSIFIAVILFFVACGNKNRVDLRQAEFLLSSLSDKMIKMEYADISLQQVDSLIDFYSSIKEYESEAICRLIKGAKLYSFGDYSGAIGELKIAEQYIADKDITESAKKDILEAINCENHKYKFIIPQILLVDTDTNVIFGYEMEKVSDAFAISILRDKAEVEKIREQVQNIE